MYIFCIILLVFSVTAFPTGNSNLPKHNSLISRISGQVIQAIFGTPPSDPAVFTSISTRKYPLHDGYDKEVVLRFNISNEKEARSLNSAADTLLLDIWESNQQWADIRVSKDSIGSLLGLLPQSMHGKHDLLIHDLSKAVRQASSSPEQDQIDLFPSHETMRREFSPSMQPRPDHTNIFFHDYQPLSVIVPWMRLMQSLFSTHVSLIDIGASFEGRSILGLKVGVHPRNSEQPIQTRKTILVTGGSHAREWITVSSVTYAAYALITSYGKSKQITKMIEEFDWVFIPTINPDGYVKTWELDRLWRKNTQDTSVRFCQGYDIDRSFPFGWDGEATKANPCSGGYAGDIPLQAVEALRLAEWVKQQTTNNNATFVGYLDLHSYSQQILYPYGFSCIQTPPTLETLEEIALGLAKAIYQQNREFYGVTSACEGGVGAGDDAARDKPAWPTIGGNGGSALDWMYHEAGTKYAFQIKLPDTGSHGFLLPRKYIVPTGEDIFGAISYLGNYLLGNKGVESYGKPQTSQSSSMVRLSSSNAGGRDPAGSQTTIPAFENIDLR